ncbi:MAG: ABC transporter ATP-binding protein [Rhodocyclaceae bacterium]
MSSLDVRHIQKRYGAVKALDDVSLSIPAGSRAAIVGPSGSGKTSLLRIVAGFEFPDAGTVHCNDTLLADGPSIVPAHRRGIGYVPQDGALFPHLSVAANIGFGLALEPAARAERIRELMDLVSLDAAMLKRWPHELSGGQQQRVALARALAQQPSLMLLDEPFSALDAGLRATTRKAVARLLSEARITTVLVTHDQDEALSFAEQLIILQDGKLMQAGAPSRLYWQPQTEETARFLGDAIVMTATLQGGHAQCALGTVQADSTDTCARARILLRPEQIRLAPADTLQDALRVASVEFAGHTCQVELHPAANTVTDTSPRLHVPCPSFDAPAIDSLVRAHVQGAAHVLRPLVEHIAETDTQAAPSGI